MRRKRELGILSLSNGYLGGMGSRHEGPGNYVVFFPRYDISNRAGRGEEL